MIIRNNFSILLLAILSCLSFKLYASPIVSGLNNFQCQSNGILNFDSQKEYEYDFSTKTKLWINDVSNDAESLIYLNTTVLIQLVEPCRYQMKLRDVRVQSETISDNRNVASELETNVALFSIGSNGILSSNVHFNKNENNWVKNIKRAIISSFQLRSENELKLEDPLLTNKNDVKSSVLYETDLFGKCRTIYQLKNNNNGNIDIVKKKSLHDCYLNEYRDNEFLAQKYSTTSEYNKGHKFIDNHRCEINIGNGLLRTVSCKHTSTMQYASYGNNGLQAVSELNLSLKRTNPASSIISLNKIEPSSIVHEYNDQEQNDDKDFNIKTFIDNVCLNSNAGVLDANHAKNFRSLINSLKTKSRVELIQLVDDATNKCKFAGHTIITGILFVNTESSVEAIMDLLDNNDYQHLVRISELSRYGNPSAGLITKLKEYLIKKDSKFVYLKNMYLMYSTLIKTFCSRNNCNEYLDDWTSFLVDNLGTNCLDSKNKELIVVALKSIGNVGYIKDTSILEKCSLTKQNSLEIRIAAIQSFRRFDCNRIKNLDGNYKLLLDTNDDAEIRINSFKNIVRCSENNDKFIKFASEKFGEFLSKEEDHQVVSYIASYIKERDITLLMNAIFLNPNIKEKLELRFKDASWNNYRFRYSFQRNAAIEADSSMIYTKKSYVPRSVHFNFTLHGYGLSLNDYDYEIRMQGLDEIIKQVVVDKITSSEQLIKRLTEKPKQLLDILKLVAAKLKYSSEKPYVSMSVRYFGSEVYFFELDNLDNLKILNGLFGDMQYWIDWINKESNSLTNWQIYNGQIKKPLLNGFEFGERSDVNFGYLHKHKGSMNVVDKTRTDFSFNSNDGFSMFIRRHLSVEINNENKILIRNDVNGVLNNVFGYDGFRDGNVLQYNFNIDPQEQFQYMLVEGKYYKLDKNSNYIEIKEFKVPQKQYELCMGKETKKYFGVDVCYSVKRPELRSFNEVMKSLNNPFNYYDLVEDSDDWALDADDESYDDNDKKEYKRPMAILTGPFRYEVIIYNKDRINKYIFKGKANRTETKDTWESNWETLSNNGSLQKRVEFTYTYEVTGTSRTYKNQMYFDVKTSQDNETKFLYSNIFDYRNRELIDYEVKIIDKLLTGDRIYLNFNRQEKMPSQLFSNYFLKSTYNSVIFNKNFDLMWDLKNIRRSVISNLLIKNNEIELISSNLKLEQNLESEHDTDYNIEIYGVTFAGPEFKLSGPLAYGYFSSNIDLDGYLKWDLYDINAKINFKSSHIYDPTNESFIKNSFTIPVLNVVYNSKLAYQFNDLREAMSLEYNTLSSNLPSKIYFDYNKTNDKSFESGFTNLLIDLTSFDGKLGNYIKNNILHSEMLNDFLIEINENNSDNDRKDVNIKINVNKNELANIDHFRFGNLNAILANPNEIPIQNLGLGMRFTAMQEYEGGLECYFGVEISKSKKIRNFTSQVKASGVIGSLLKLEDMDLKSSNINGIIDFYTKITRIGHYYKGVIMTANKTKARVDGDMTEFDIDYMKTFSDDTKSKGRGIVKFQLKDLFNFYILFNVPQMFTIETSIKNTFTNLNKFSFEGNLYTLYIDAPKPSETSYDYELSKLPSIDDKNNEILTIKIGGMGGKPGLDLNELYFNFDVDTKMIQKRFDNGDKKVVDYNEKFQYKQSIPKFDINYESKYIFDLKTNDFKVTSKSKAEFPAYFEKKSNESRFYNYDFILTHDFKNEKENIIYNFESNCKFFNFGLKYMKLNYVEERTPIKLYDGRFNVDYKILDEQLHNFKLNSNFDKCGQQCVDMRFNVEQDFIDLCKRPLMTIKVDRKNGYPLREDILNLITIKCDDLVVTNTQILYKHEPKNQLEPSMKLLNGYWLIKSDSDLYESKEFLYEMKPFTINDGFIKYLIKWNSQINYDGLYEYSYEYNDSMKMISTIHKMVSNIGSKYKSLCEFRIDKKSNYMNKANCILNVASENEPFTYGYKLFIPKTGHSFDLNIKLLNGRVIQIDGKGSGNKNGEFTSSTRIYWDYARDHKKFVILNLNSIYVEPNHHRFTIDVSDTPLIKIAKFEMDHVLLVNETKLDMYYLYELKNGKSNRYDVLCSAWSTLTETTYSLKTIIQKPKYSFYYGNSFNKLNGRLNRLEVKVNDLIDFNVYNEYENQNTFRLSLEFNENIALLDGYKLDKKSSYENNMYKVISTILRNGKRISSITSVHDPSNTRFDVKGETIFSNYELNLGLFDETSFNGYLRQDGKLIGISTMKFSPINRKENEILWNLRWNSFWPELENFVLGEKSSTSNNEMFSSDFRPIYESFKQERELWKKDLLKFYDTHMEYLCSVSKSFEEKRQEMLKSRTLLSQMNKTYESKKESTFKRYLKFYSSMSDKLSNLNDNIMKTNYKFLSIMIPRLSKMSYNGEDAKSDFDNNFKWSKRSLSKNIYQLSSVYRNTIRVWGNQMQLYKSLFVHDINDVTLRALYNKYRYRIDEHDDYEFISSVFNKRNIIGFGGEAEIIHTKSRYLLAHDIYKNKFSIILNNDNDNQESSILSVYLYNKDSINIGYNKATINNKTISLPKNIKFDYGKNIYISRSHEGICVHVDDEIKVCCYEESKSCTIGLSGWWYGKVNGLLGETNHHAMKLKQENWSIDNVEFRRVQLKPANYEAIKTCNKLFGKHRTSLLRHAYMAVRPNGWRKVCEAALTSSESNYCPLIRALAKHAQTMYVEVKIPEQCYNCLNNQINKTYKINEKVLSDENQLEQGSDFVFISLPCDSKKTGLNYDALLKEFNKDKKNSNNYYLIKIDKNEMSAYQAENGKFVNFEIRNARLTLERNSNEKINDEVFYEAIYYAQTLFTKRVASSRYLIITSCGNCLPFDPIKETILANRLASRNIIVNSWSNYNIKLLHDETDDIVIGYNQDKLYYYLKGTTEIIGDVVNNYKIQHEIDMCHRLALKTYGSIFNINELKNTFVLNTLPSIFEKNRRRYSISLDSCELVKNRKFGDFSDFTFNRNVNQYFDDNDDEVL